MSIDFLTSLMEEIITKGRATPKVQVERYISPILSMFIEEILFEKYNKKYKLIMPEFPIRKGTISNSKEKGSNQSTNIDYLLYNTHDKIFTFVELKTESSSFKPSQLEIYQKLETLCKENEGEIPSFGELLKNDLEKIQEATSHKHKYNYLLSMWEPRYDNVTKMEIIYLVPKATELKDPEKVIGIPKDNILYFEDLREDMDHHFKYEWSILVNYLHQLDAKFTFNKIQTNGIVSETFNNLKILDLVEFKASKVQPTIIQLQNYINEVIEGIQLKDKCLLLPINTAPSILKDNLEKKEDFLSINIEEKYKKSQTLSNIAVKYYEDFEYGVFTDYNLDADTVKSISEYEKVSSCLASKNDCSYIESYSFDIYLELSFKGKK